MKVSYLRIAGLSEITPIWAVHSMALITMPNHALSFPILLVVVVPHTE